MSRKKSYIRHNKTIVMLFISLILVSLIVLVGIRNNQDTRSRAADVVYSIAINQPIPHFGDSVNFTAVYPKEADKRIGKQQLYQPSIQIDCYQNNIKVFSQHAYIASKVQNRDGSITGVTNFIFLRGISNGLSWTGGAANCYASLYYFTTTKLIYHFLAQSQFSVAE